MGVGVALKSIGLDVLARPGSKRLWRKDAYTRALAMSSGGRLVGMGGRRAAKIDR